MTLDPQIEPTLEEMMASDVFDRAVFTSEPDWQSADEDEEEQTAVNAAPAAAISETDRAAIRTDLQPLVNAVATLVQNKGGTPPELNWDAITDAVFLNRSLEGELMGQMGEAFLLGLGIGPDELAQVLKEATADNS